MDIPHDMDHPTEFCRKCGAGAFQILDKNYICTAAPNVIGVSHIIARRKFENVVPLPLASQIGTTA